MTTKNITSIHKSKDFLVKKGKSLQNEDLSKGKEDISSEEEKEELQSGSDFDRKTEELEKEEEAKDKI